MNTKLVGSMNLGVKAGGKELIFSGFVHIDQPKIEVEFDDMVIEFKFIADDTGRARYETSIDGQKKLIFNLYNHTNSLGEGLYTPLEIGEQDNRKLFITYFVSTANSAENKRRVEFALYLGDQI